MTRVFGQLFPDNRNGILAICPTKPFFGCSRDERHFPVKDGAIDIELLPTPSGVTYKVGFKEEGDTRRTDYTLNWRIPFNGQVNITPKLEDKPKSEEQHAGRVSDLVQIRRLASELEVAISSTEEEKAKNVELQRQLQLAETKISELISSAEINSKAKDRIIAELQAARQPVIKTVIQKVLAPNQPLIDRVKRLEADVQRLTDLNETYYQSFVELHQLKLERAKSQAPAPIVEEFPSSPQERLFRKLTAK